MKQIEIFIGDWHKRRKKINDTFIGTVHFFSSFHVLVFLPPSNTHLLHLVFFCILQRLPFLSCHSSSFWHILVSSACQLWPKEGTHKKTDGEMKVGIAWGRWKERKKMRGGGGGGRGQALLFLAAGASIFILLYNWYSLYMMITVLSADAKPKLYFSLIPWFLLAASHFVILLLCDRKAGVVTTSLRYYNTTVCSILQADLAHVRRNNKYHPNPFFYSWVPKNFPNSENVL